MFSHSKVLVSAFLGFTLVIMNEEVPNAEDTRQPKGLNASHKHAWYGLCTVYTFELVTSILNTESLHIKTRISVLRLEDLAKQHAFNVTAVA